MQTLEFSKFKTKFFEYSKRNTVSIHYTSANLLDRNVTIGQRQSWVIKEAI